MYLNEIEDRPLPDSVRRPDNWIVAVPVLVFAMILAFVVSTWWDAAVDPNGPDGKPQEFVQQIVTPELSEPRDLPDLSNEEDPQDTPGYVGPTPLPGVYLVDGAAIGRSGRWPAVRDAYFRDHPNCAFAGCKFKGPKQIHHLQPFHLRPELELDPKNLVTVCSGGVDDKGHPSPNHHLWVCHNGNFRDYNRHAKADLAAGRYPKKGAELFIKHEEKHGRSPPKTILAP